MSTKIYHIGKQKFYTASMLCFSKEGKIEKVFYYDENNIIQQTDNFAISEFINHEVEKLPEHYAAKQQLKIMFESALDMFVDTKSMFDFFMNLTRVQAEQLVLKLK